MLTYDQNGNLVDDGMDDTGDPYGYNSNMFAQPQSAPAYSTSKWNFGQQLPMGQPQINQQLTGRTALMKLAMDPRMLYEAQVATGQPTMDLNAWAGLNPDGTPYTGAGGGGGGGGGGGYQSVFTTPYSDSLAQSDDPHDKLIWSGLQSKQGPGQIMRALVQNDPNLQADQNAYNNLSNTVNKAFEEQAGFQRNELRGGQTQQTPIQQWGAKYGLVNPTTQYDEANLPPDIGMAPVDAANMRAVSATQGIDSRLAAMQRQLKGIAPDQGTGLTGYKWWGENKMRVPTGPQLISNTPGVPGEAELTYSETGTPYIIPASQRGTPPQETKEVRVFRPIWRGPNAQQQQANAANQAQRQALQRQIQMQQDRRASTEENRAGYESMARRVAANQLQQQGRTPARDAQRAVYNYLRSGGLAV